MNGKAYIIGTWPGDEVSNVINEIEDLGEEFNPLDYVKALSYKGNEITSNIEIDQNIYTCSKWIYNKRFSCT